MEKEKRFTGFEMSPSPSSSMEDLRSKLLQIVRKHEESKTAFLQLRSQIKIGLLEAQDVIVSLSMPLMKLVGLKIEEMAFEGRSTSIILNPHLQPQYVGDVSRSESSARWSETGDREHRRHLRESTELESYSSRAAKACREIKEKQRHQLSQLLSLLRQIETRVNSHHDAILQSLDDHRLSLGKHFNKAAALLSAIHRSGRTPDPTPLLLAFKIVQATFEQVDSTLGSVEEDVEMLVRELAQQMCTPMIAHAKGLRDEVVGVGASARLVGVVEEMVRVVRDRGVELVEARKRARVEEEGKKEALRRLKEFEEKLMGMKEFVELFLEAKRRFKELSLPTSNELLGIEKEKDQISDDKLLWDLLQKNKRVKQQFSPSNRATELYLHPNKVKANVKSAVGSSSRRQSVIIGPRPTTRIYARQVESLCHPSDDSLFPRLGCSPSANLNGAITRSRRGIRQNERMNQRTIQK